MTPWHATTPTTDRPAVSGHDASQELDLELDVVEAALPELGDQS